jgi:long-chain acyl-CoA synthetase
MYYTINIVCKYKDFFIMSHKNAMDAGGFFSLSKLSDIKRYRSLSDLFKKSCRQFSKQVAFRQMGENLNYQNLEEQSRCFAAFLRKNLRLKKGDRVGIMLPNCFQFVIALFGIFRSGCVAVPINPLDTPRELEYQLKNAQVSTVIVFKPFLNTVKAAYQKTDLKTVIVTDFADLFPFFKRKLLHSLLGGKRILSLIKNNLRGEGAPKIFVKHFSCQIYSFREVLKLGKNFKYQDPKLDLEDLALLQYTGGTTGMPKVVMLTHYNMLANIMQCVNWAKPVLSIGEERVVIALPLYHIFALTVCCLSFLWVGGTGTLIADPRDISTLIRAFRKENPSIFVGVNTLFQALMNHSHFKSLDFSSLKLVLSGGMKLQKKVATQWQKITGSLILEGYGLTEASPVVSGDPVHSKSFNGSIGLSMALTRVSIRDDQGKELPEGAVGELWVKGPQVMKGYWKSEKETKNVFARGWLKTGDMAYVDSKGLIYLVDRKKELIIVSGFNVYPSEVEEVLLEHPDVLEAAVIGFSNSKAGEAVKAFVIKKKNADVSESQLIHYCKMNLLHYKVPSKIRFVKSFPRNAVGKVLKRALV